jgi:hypothetical protein
VIAPSDVAEVSVERVYKQKPEQRAESFNETTSSSFTSGPIKFGGN